MDDGERGGRRGRVGLDARCGVQGTCLLAFVHVSDHEVEYWKAVTVLLALLVNGPVPAIKHARVFNPAV